MTQGAILVTGATGFIGSHLVRRLIGDGWRVHVVVRAESNRIPLDDLGDDVCFHVHDGTTEGMIEIVRDAAPVAVFHLASLFLAQHTSGDVTRLMRSNVEFPAQLLEAMAVNDVRMLINTGTSWQHFRNMEYNPVCLYAATKQAFDAILRFYVDNNGLGAITLKLFDTYGPGDPRPKLVNLFQRAAASGAALAMSPGEQLIDLVYIDDVIDAFMVAFARLRAGLAGGLEEYGISSEAPLPLKEVAATYAQVSGCPLNIEWGARAYRSREVMQPWTAFERLPGWSPKVDLASGFARCL
jgi:nucleoside-diphosphate-sugar epimerase